MSVVRLVADVSNVTSDFGFPTITGVVVIFTPTSTMYNLCFSNDTEYNNLRINLNLLF